MTKPFMTSAELKAHQAAIRTTPITALNVHGQGARSKYIEKLRQDRRAARVSRN